MNPTVVIGQAVAAAPTIPEPVLYTVIGALGLALTVLWRYYTGRIDKCNDSLSALQQQVATERERLAAERTEDRKDAELTEQKLRAEYETRYRLVLEDARNHEDTLRAEFLESIQAMSAKASESNAEVSQVLQKMLDRFVGGRPARPRSNYER